MTGYGTHVVSNVPIEFNVDGIEHVERVLISLHANILVVIHVPLLIHPLNIADMDELRGVVESVKLSYNVFGEGSMLTVSMLYLVRIGQ
jgi:hypothetical protein